MRTLAVLTFVLIGAACTATATDNVFDKKVAPILVKHCIECHNANDFKGKLDLQSKAGFLRGGELGLAFNETIPAESVILQRVQADEMPPEQPLAENEKAILKQWVESGATWGTDPINIFEYSSPDRAGYDWWSLQPLTMPRPPGSSMSQTGRVSNPVDQFILRNLQLANLPQSPRANRSLLARRAYLDLTGLPPTTEQVNDFIRNDAPDAYEQLIDRLLASPRYGERWARHWLDVVRFGESQGFERDKLRPHSWRYRDWVIDALNQDIPYDKFARLQLAGDLIEGHTSQGRIATGFLGAGTWDEVGFSQRSPVFKRVVRADQLEDLTAAISQSFLGLTVNCARCHDHKFDPITQKEYYQVTASLASVYHGRMSFIDQLSAGEQSANERQKEVLLHRHRILQSKINNVRQDVRSRLKAEGRPHEEKDVTAALPSVVREHWMFEARHLKDQAGRWGDYSVYAIAPKAPDETFLFIRGNPEQRGEQVNAGGIASVVATAADFNLPNNASDQDRRIALANWVTKNNALFARTIVNRLWHYHFGMGIVDTPNDFGFNGGQPSHPELLEWLASELVKNNFSLKYIQRLIVTSETYQQSSRANPEAEALDANNRLLWRYGPKRMTAETLRDTVLLLSGQLNTDMHGPGYYDFTTFVANSQFYNVFDPIGETFNRRTIYRTLIRSGRNRFLDVFDCPDPSAKAPRRATTTTPLQSLSLMNHSFSVRAAERYANKLIATYPDQPQDQLMHLFQEAFCREITEDELALAIEVYQEAGLIGVCRAIINTNEFIYIR